MVTFNAFDFRFIVLIFVLFGNVDGILVTKPEDAEVIVGQNAVINCRTSDVYPVRWEHTPVGSTKSRDVYISRTIVEPYSPRFSNVADEKNGDYSLLIDSVHVEDSGRYECLDKAGHGERHSAQLVVLASVPECRSNINPDGMIGDNDCGIEPEDIEFNCSLKYSGNISPVLEWKKTEGRHTSYITLKTMIVDRAPGQVTSTAIITPNNEINGHSITCQTTLSKVNWTSETLKVLYAYNTQRSVQINQSNHEMCLANSSQRCTYKWTEIDSQEQEVTSVLTRSIHIDHPGIFICNADCPLRGRNCTVQPKSVEFIYKETTTSSLQKNWFWILLAVIVFVTVFAVVGLIITVTHLLRLLRTRNQDKFEYRLKTPLEAALIQGVAVLNGRVYVFRRGFSDVLVFRALDPHDKLDEMKNTKVVDPRDAATCFISKCLYVTDANDEKTVWKMEENENITAWMGKIQKPYTISVNKDGLVLLPQLPNKIAIYDSDASPWRTIVLCDDVRDIQHAIELPKDRYLVSHGENNDKKHEVLMIGNDGKTIKRFGRERGWKQDQLYHPRHVITGDDKVFVADKLNNRVMVLDNELNYLDEIRYPETITYPTRLCYEKGNLMIGEYKALHIACVTSIGHVGRTRKISSVKERKQSDDEETAQSLLS